MFDIQLFAGIRAIKVKMKEKNGVVARKCAVVLEREFDEAIAAGLGGDAKRALHSLEGGGMSSCVLPIDAVDVEGKFKADADAISVGSMFGVKATAKRNESDDDIDLPPSISLEFEFAWNEQAWAFFGRHCGGTATLLLKPRQGSLPFTRPAVVE